MEKRTVTFGTASVTPAMLPCLSSWRPSGSTVRSPRDGVSTWLFSPVTVRVGETLCFSVPMTLPS